MCDGVCASHIDLDRCCVRIVVQCRASVIRSRRVGQLAARKFGRRHMGLLQFFRTDYAKLVEDVGSADLRTEHGQKLLKKLRAAGSSALFALRDKKGWGTGLAKAYDSHLEPERFSDFWIFAVSAEITKRAGDEAFRIVVATLGDSVWVRHYWAESVLLYMGGMWCKGQSLQSFQPLDFRNRMWQEVKKPLIDHLQGAHVDDEKGCLELLANISSANDVESIVERLAIKSARTFEMYLGSVSGVDDKAAFRRRYQELMKIKEAT